MGTSQSETLNKPIPHYETGGRYHSNICSTYTIKSKSLEKKISTEHSGIEICFTKNNYQKMQVRNKTITLAPGNLVIYNANEPHTEIYHKKNDANFHAVLINPEFINEILEETNVNANELVFDDFIYNPNKNYMNHLSSILEIRESEDHDKLSMECLMTQLIMETLDLFTHSDSKKIESYKTTGFFPKKSDQVKKIIGESFTDHKLNLDYISKSCGVSKFHLIRLFKKTTGISIGSYISHLKIAESKRRLLKTNNKISDIAQDVGFNDLSTFNKSFLKHTTISPRQFRTLSSR